MKVQIICEECNNVVELTPIDNGQHAHMSKIQSHFNMFEIELDYDYNVDEIEDVTATVEEIRIDCKSCGNYIVLNEFPDHICR